MIWLKTLFAGVVLVDTILLSHLVLLVAADSRTHRSRTANTVNSFGYRLESVALLLNVLTIVRGQPKCNHASIA